MLKTRPLPCTVVVCVCVCVGGGGGGGRGKRGVARLVLTGCGIVVSEIFGAIREDSRCCV